MSEYRRFHSPGVTWFFNREEGASKGNVPNPDIGNEEIFCLHFQRALFFVIQREAVQLITGQGYNLKRYVWLEGSLFCFLRYSSCTIKTLKT